MEKLCVGYVRVSTEQQADEDKFGVQAQKDAINEYAKQHGYKVAKFFVDKVSGVEEHKPEWEKILFAEDIMNPPFEAVIVFKYDRVSRELFQLCYCVLELKRKGITLHSTIDDLDLEKPESKMLFAVMGYCAEKERENIALRTSHGRKMKAACGGYAGGRAPFGYYAKEGRLLVDEYERPVVKYIFELDNTPNEKGYRLTYRTITELVNKKGYRQRNGKPFTVAVIYQIIQNRKVYQGYYKYGKEGKWVKGVQERII